ncbi:MAG: hypothetical protein NVSMB55_15730 [Mycobacteriales bacterium]
MQMSVSTVLGGRYELVDRLAVGGMGEVWVARDTLLHRDVAIKVPRPEYAADSAFRDRLRQEARHAAGLAHPNIAAVYDLGEEIDQPYLVMALVQGRPLSQLLAERGALPPEQVQAIITDVAAALAVAHAAGVVHRDIKPANLLICPGGPVVVTDFGIARAVDAASSTGVGLLLGTAQYIAPEQVAGAPAGLPSDLYALGVVAYECLTGHRPFDGDIGAVLSAHRHLQVPALPGHVPADLSRTVMGLLDKDPSRRPTAAQLQSATGAPAVARPPKTAAPAAPTQVLDPYPPSWPADTPGVPRGSRLGPARSALACSALACSALLGAVKPASSARRKIGRRAGAAAGAGVLVAALAVAVVASTSSGEGHPPPGATRATDQARPNLRTLPISSARLFHPGGSDQDHPADVHLAYDGNPSTAWTTQHYADATFGSLRPGVGIVFDLGTPQAVRRLRLAMTSAGSAVEVHAGNDPDQLLREQLVDRAASAPALIDKTLPQPARARYWLVWVSRLPAAGNHQAGIAEISLLS